SAEKQLDLQATGQADLRMLSLFTERFQAEGIVNLNLFIGGTFDRTAYSGRLVAENFTLSTTEPPIQLTNGKITAQIEGQQAVIDATADVNGSPLTAQGTVPLQKDGTLNVRVKGQSDLKNLAVFTTAAEGAGIVNLDVLISGSVTKPQLTGGVRSEKFQLNVPDHHLALTDANAAANFDGDRIQLASSGLLNGSPFTLSGTLPVTETPGEIHGSLQNLAVSTLVTDANISGAVDVSIDARGTGRRLANWSGDISLMPEHLQIGEHPIAAIEPLRIRLTSGMAEFYPFRLRADNALDLSAQGAINFRTDKISGNIQAEIELSLLTNFLTNTAADGKMEAELHVDGTAGNPTLTGVVRVQDGFFRRFQSPILLERVQLVAPVEQNKITLQTFTAQMGGGSIEGSGTIRLSNWNPADMQLAFRARNVGMVYPEDLRSQLDADLTLTRERNDFLLAGDVRILRSTYREDIDPRQRL
ncbi:MAG TPA: translocation/assembly module TamB domain-containing protein, partial [Acidobacteriota bacterium]|nr:translocation/assembly module TamB domain-containing protein [Acidobacteriota bacterium]